MQIQELDKEEKVITPYHAEEITSSLQVIAVELREIKELLSLIAQPQTTIGDIKDDRNEERNEQSD